MIVLRGAYSIVSLVADEGLLAFRDPHGIRPLTLGKRGKDYCVVSESQVLDALDFKFIRDIEAGEVVFIPKEGEPQSVFPLKQMPWKTPQKKAPCMFEWVYFARACGEVEGRGVYSARRALGERLAFKIKEFLKEESDDSIDLVAPVPESGRTGAQALAYKLNLPYKEILIKNRYIHRSFLLKSPEDRKKAVKLKLAPIHNEIKGKSILLVDDSIVRGTTSKHIVEMLFGAGAKNVFMASTCPPIRFPCFYGIDFPDQNELVAFGKDVSKIADEIKATKVFYPEIDDLKKAIEKENLCMACLDGNYPVKNKSMESFAQGRLGQRKENL